MPRDARSNRRSADATSPAARSVRAAGEVLLLGVIAVSPWAYGCVDPLHEFFLALAVFGLAVLWAAHAGLTGRFTLRPDVGSLALAGLVGWTAFQLVPLPEGVVAVVSPGRADWHRTLVPVAEEVLPGEAAGRPRAGFVPLSANPAATRALVARLMALLVVYTAARNWLADRESLARLLGVLLGVGLAVAAFALWRSAVGQPPPGSFFELLGGNAFGPFVNRNHYPDFVGLCVGGGLGLLLARPAEGEDWVTPRRLFTLLAVGVVLMTVPLSLSRGGILATLAAGAGAWVLSRVGRDDVAGGWGRLALAGAVGLTLVAAATLGSAAVESRFSGVGAEAGASGSRLPTWQAVLTRVVPRFPLTGTGGGTFEAVEPTVRTDAALAGLNYEYAHNDYLEALAEGGLVRLLLTLVLAGGVLLVVGRGAVERRDRSVGGPVLGLWVGLAVVAFHAVTDFAVHTPAIAVTAAAVAGFAAAAAADGGFVPHRVKVRKKKSRDGKSVLTELPAVGTDTPPPPAVEPEPGGRWVARGPVAWALGGLVAAAALLVAADANTRRRAAAFELAANAAAVGRLPAEDRVKYADARAAVRPDDPNGHLLAAEAHLQAAYTRTLEGSAGVLGAAGGWAARGDRLADGPEVRAAVDHLRAARRASPLAARAHARLGLLADQFSGEPAAAHFDRAKRLLPADPEVWYAAGRAAHRRGDRASSFADWRQGLALSAARLPDMLAALKAVPVAELRASLLPAEPAVSAAAADALFPDRLRQAAERRPFLAAAVEQAKAKAAAGGEDYIAAATAADELGRPEQAADFWLAAVANAPRGVRVRDGYAAWLEKEERYEEAVDQLRQMQKLTTFPGIQDRIEGCYHGLKLKRAMGEYP